VEAQVVANKPALTTNVDHTSIWYGTLSFLPSPQVCWSLDYFK